MTFHGTKLEFIFTWKEMIKFIEDKGYSVSKGQWGTMAYKDITGEKAEEFCNEHGFNVFDPYEIFEKEMKKKMLS